MENTEQATQVEQTEQTEQVKTKIDVIKIGERIFDASTITDLTKVLMQDIKRIDEEIENINVQLGIYKLAKLKLIDEVAKELPKMTEVKLEDTKID